jgi:parallel beta-helix repeat protein
VLTLEPVEPRLLLSTFEVTGTGDSGPGTLRQAILDSNADPAPTGQSNLIDFEIGTGVQTIEPTSSLPTIRATVAIDSTLSSFGSGQVIRLDGAQAGLPVDGLTIQASGVLIRGLTIQEFSGSAIQISGGGNDRIEGNILGANSPDGLTFGNGGDGVSVGGSTNDTIGGTAAGSGNVISGNVDNGLRLYDGSNGTLIEGNLIGLDPSGKESVPNQRDGILIQGVAGTTIGGSTAQARNVISSNGIDGVEVNGSGDRGSVIQGNFIGTDSSGLNDLGNLQYGVSIENASGNLIGGSGAGEGNLISANQLIGVQLYGPGATANLLLGNTIGLDVTGRAPIANGGDGVYVYQAPDNVIGGNSPGDRNIISGNGLNGIEIFGEGSTGEVVEGNFIGTGSSGTDNQGNTLNGVEINDASNNTIGGTTSGAANVISGNRLNGVQVVVTISDSSATGNMIEGNFIGTDAQGSGFNASGILVSPGNAGDGVQVDGTYGDVSGNTIGGTLSGSGNVISGNAGNGVAIIGPNFHTNQEPGALATNQLIAGNIIGLDTSGVRRLGNSQDGILVRFADGVLIGGTSAASRNVVSANQQAGIDINQSDFVAAEGNIIGGDALGINQLGNFGSGVSLSFDANNTVGGASSGAGNLIFGNGGSGISLISTSDNAILGNTIGLNIGDLAISEILNPDGTPQLLGNHNDGITLDLNSTGNTIGGTTSGDRNVISGNLKNGITVINASDANLIQGNYVGLDQTGLSGQGNKLNGVYLTTIGNTVGGTVEGSANVVSANLNSGVVIAGSSGTDNLVAGNLIGTNFRGGVNPDGTEPDVGLDNQPIGNRQDGVFVNDDALGNTIGGTSATSRNVISGNGSNGIQILGININAGTDAIGLSGNIVAGNFIGTDASGLNADGNAASGVFLYNARANVVGTSSPGGGNVISGNLGSGLAIQGEDATNNIVFGNLIGTDALGTSPLGNLGDGVTLVKADFNQIGGLGPGEGNVILGNGGDGVSISTSNSPVVAGDVIAGNLGDGVTVASGSNNALIVGNKIGVDASGEVAVGNHLDGVRLADAGLNAQILANVIADNSGAGVEVSGLSSTAVIQGNLIGLDASGTVGQGNATGVLINGVPDVVVGGLTFGTGNFISGNKVGIEVTAPDDTSMPLDDLIAGNVIGLDLSGNRAVGNTFGIFVNDAVGVTIGGTTPAARNVISGNTGVGVQLFRVSVGGSGDLIEGNFIGLNTAGLAVPIGGLQPIGVFLNSASNNTVGGTVPGSANVISGNTTGNADMPSYGVSIFGQSNAKPLDNLVVGNLIGTDATGAPLLNSSRAPIQTTGVAINLSSGNLIGGGDPSDRNTIAGNVVGIQLAGSIEPLPGFTAGNTIQGNTIDANTYGVFLTNGSHNKIVGNDLSLNTSIGLSIVGTASGSNTATSNRIFGNGSAASGASSSNPIGDGVYIESAVNNTITGNTIQANGLRGTNPSGVGVYVFDNASGNKVTSNIIQGNTGYGILVYNSASNLSSIPLNGKTANTIGGSGIASFREYTGPVTTTTTTSASVVTTGTSTPKGPKIRKKSR